MTTPLKQFVPTLVHTEKVNNASVATTGVKLSYVCPAGRVCKVLDASIFLTAGAAPTIALQAILGGVTVTLQNFTTNADPNTTVWLAAGDTIQWNVTVAGAAGTADLTICCEDYEAQ